MQYPWLSIVLSVAQRFSNESIFCHDVILSTSTDKHVSPCVLRNCHVLGMKHFEECNILGYLSFCRLHKGFQMNPFSVMMLFCRPVLTNMFPPVFLEIVTYWEDKGLYRMFMFSKEITCVWKTWLCTPMLLQLLHLDVGCRAFRMYDTHLQLGIEVWAKI